MGKEYGTKGKKRIPKINSIHFGLRWIGISLTVGGIIPLCLYPVFHRFIWPLCVVGAIGLLGFAVIFIFEMHQDFGKVPYYQKRLAEDIPFDAHRQIPVIKCSICTGEQIAGFKDKETQAFTEVMVLRTEADLVCFKKAYGLGNIRKEY